MNTTAADTPEAAPFSEQIKDNQRRNAKKLSEEVRDVIERRGWTMRQAEIQTGVERTTVFNLAHGQRVGGESAARFAEAAGLDPVRFLAMANGVPEDRITPEGFGVQHVTVTDSEGRKIYLSAPAGVDHEMLQRLADTLRAHMALPDVRIDAESSTE